MKREFIYEIIYRPNSIWGLGEYPTNEYYTYEELANFYIQYYTDFPHKYYVNKIEAKVFHSSREQKQRLEGLKCLMQKIKKLKEKFPNDTEVINEEIMLNNTISNIEHNLNGFETEEENVKSSRATISAINYPNGEKRVSAIYWDKGPIIVDAEDEME